MSQEITTIQIEKKEKSKAWGQFGLALPDFENDLANAKLEIEKVLSLVPAKGNIKELEPNLKNAKILSKSLEEKRKGITVHLDNVKERLMVPEKAVQDQLKAYELQIIAVKKVIESENAALTAVDDEKKDLITKIKASYIEYFAECLRIVNDLIHSTYSNMLSTKVPFEDFDAEIKKASIFYLPDYKPFFARQNYKKQHLNDSQISLIYTDNKGDMPNYTKLFVDEMNAKKIGYKSELANVEAAKAIMDKEKKEAEKKALAEKESQQLNLKIENATAFDAVPKSDVKDLKKVFELDMPNDHTTVLALFGAFAANLDICLPELKVNKWMALTPDQVGKVLAKLKSRNNSLTFSGINFKATDKL